MPTSAPPIILTLNSGSSSLKFSVYEGAPAEQLIVAGKLGRIGLSGGTVEVAEAGGQAEQTNAELPDHAAALQLVFARLKELRLDKAITAIGHRVVLGGPRHVAPQFVTPELVQELESLCAIDPLHLPAALQTMAAVAQFRPGLPQVACFDTAFHRTLPPVAQAYPLPADLVESLGLIRFGFHGLSYAYILEELRRIAAPAAAGKVIIAHLGNGASLAALREGRSVDTTMGFSPAGGLMMGSRPGDLDPGLLLYLIREKQFSGARLQELITRESGLLGVSQLSSDMQELTAQRATHPRAEAAIALFCYQARKSLGALVAVLDGLETLVFTGGIGENSALVRAQICADFSFLGLQLAPAANEAHAAIVSAPSSRVMVRVIKTNEELMLARLTGTLLNP